jgi:GNAT superfamily N-acetyltransferase
MLTWSTLAEYLEDAFLDAGDDPVAWEARGMAVLERPYMRLVAKGRADPWDNWVERVRLDPARVPGAIREAREFFAGEGVSYSWWVGPGTRPADLGATLQAAGFGLLEEIEGLALRLPAPVDQWPVNPLVRIVPVTDVTTLRTALRLSDTFGRRDPVSFERTVARFAPQLDDPTYCRLIGYIGTFPAAEVSLEFRHGGEVAYFSGGTTLPEFRGRGLYRTLSAERVRLAQARGARWALTHAVSGMSAPICRALGFVRLCVLRGYTEGTVG